MDQIMFTGNWLCECRITVVCHFWILFLLQLSHQCAPPGLCDLWAFWPLSAIPDTGSTERTTQKRKMPSPSHSSNGHSSAETSPCPTKKKKKPGALGSSKDQVTIRKTGFKLAVTANWLIVKTASANFLIIERPINQSINQSRVLFIHHNVAQSALQNYI